MITVVRMLEPVFYGERIFLPLVRDTTLSGEQGVAVSMSPIAFLYSEAGTWMFVPLDEDIGPEILEKLA
jgi:hypothetical protein